MSRNNEALESGFSQVAKNCQIFCQSVGGVFLTFFLKIKDDNSIWQTARDGFATTTSRATSPSHLVDQGAMTHSFFCQH
jgi:hypothetical protein